MNIIIHFISLVLFFLMIPLQGIRDPFSFESSNNICQKIASSTNNDKAKHVQEKTPLFERNELGVGDTVNDCKVVGISGNELVLQNKEGHLRTICFPCQAVNEN